MLRDPALWRDLAWVLVSGPVGLVLCGAAHPWCWPIRFGSWLALPPSVVLLPASVIVLAVWWVAAPRLIWIDAQLTRSLLAPTENSRLAIRGRELAESQADAVDAQAAELRRIERDCTTVRKPGWSP